MTRSRTGCMTCRKRKLKCDEVRPRCGQCNKANRECEPSTGITFRHQHNASLNALGGGPSGEQNQLKSFYNYRESFGRDTIWAVLPKGDFTFHNISNPYEDPTEPMSNNSGRDIAYPQNPYQQPSSQEYASNAVAQLQAAVSSMPHPHSLHALSQAIELHTPPQANMLPRPASNPDNPFEGPFEDVPSGVDSSTPFATAPAIATAKQALNTPTAVDSSIDPSLMTPSRRHEQDPPPNNNTEQSSNHTAAT